MLHTSVLSLLIFRLSTSKGSCIIKAGLTSLFAFCSSLSLVSTSIADILIADGTQIVRVNADGSNPTTLISDAAMGMFYDSVDMKLYYVGPGDSIRRANRDGTNIEILIPDAGDTVVDLVVDRVNNKIIWTDYLNARIRRSNLDGSGITELILGVSAPHGLILDSTTGTLYWTGLGEVQRANLDGSNTHTVVADFGGSGALSFLFLHSGKVYWSNYSDNTVKRANTDGSGIETILSGSATTKVEGIAYSALGSSIVSIGHPTGGAALHQANLDGSGIQQLGSRTGFDILVDYTLADPTATPTPSATATSTPTASPQPTSTPPVEGTNTPSPPVATATPSHTPSPTPSPTTPAATSTLRTLYSVCSPNPADRAIISTARLLDSKAIISGETLGCVSVLRHSPKLKKLYWIEDDTGRIRRANYDGSAIENLVTISDSKLTGLDVSDVNDLVVVADELNGSIYRMALDGSGLSTIVTGRAPPLRGIAFHQHRKLDSEVRLYFCENLTLKSTSFRDLNAPISNIASLTIAGVADRGYCEGMTSTNDIGGAFLTVTTSRGEVTYLTYENPRLVSNGTVNFYNPVYDFLYLPAPELEAQQSVLKFVEYYAGGDRLQMLFGPRLIPLTVFRAPTGSSIRSLVNVSVPSITTPRPTPTDGSGVTVSGKVTIIEGSTTSAKNIPVYLKSSGQLVAAGTSSTRGYAALTTKDGVYTFSDVAPGSYVLSFDRSDLAFSSPSLLISTSEEIPPVAAIQITPAPEQCTSTDKVQTLAASNEAAQRLVSLGKAQASKIRRLALRSLKGKAQSNLISQMESYSAQLLETQHAFMSTTEALPEIVIACQPQAGCSQTSYSSQIKTLDTKIRSVKTGIKRILTTGTKALRGKASIGAPATLLRADTLATKCLHANKALPKTSASCPLPNFERETAE